MNKTSDIKKGDIIYSPEEGWLMFVTEEMQLIWLSTNTRQFEAIHLTSIHNDRSSKRAITHLDTSKFFILGNIKELIQLSDKEIKHDRD